MPGNSLNIRQSIGHMLIRGGEMISGQKLETTRPRISDRVVAESLIRFRNPFSAALVRRMGVKMEPRVIKVVNGWNDVVTVGKNHLLDVTFGNSSPVTQIATWYIGLINNSPLPVLAAGDTLGSHSGWSEWTDYSGNRKAWDDADSASGIKGTTSVSTFTISADGTIYGIFVCSVASTTTGILWATGAFDETVDVQNADDLKVTYGIRT